MLPVQIRRRQRDLTDPDWFRREVDRMFDRFGEPETALTSYPVDICEDEQNVFVDAELPGFKRDDISVNIEGGVLRIQAEHKQEEEEQARARGKEYLTERRYARVDRMFTLPTGVDESKVEARLEDGVLHLTLPKREEVRPHKIEIK